MFSRNRFFSSLIIALSALLFLSVESAAGPTPDPQSSSASRKTKSSGGKSGNSKAGTRNRASKTRGSGSKRNSAPAKKGTSSKSKSTSKGKTPIKKETSADVRKRQEETRREIQRTQEELKRNEAEMKKSLSDLGRINADLEKTKGEVETLKGAVGQLDRQINSLTEKIADNEAKLAKMRVEYLKAVKKMRTARHNSSALAFIFSSDSFNQAMRRMRYLRQFSAWKDKQSKEINLKVAQLADQRKSLASAKNEKDLALKRQQVASRELEKKGREQDAVVADLKRNGDLLAVHLSKKQQEANALKSRISALIAEEERKAAAERAEAERRAAEKAAAEKAAEQRRLAEQRERELAMAEAKKEQTASDKAEAGSKKSDVKKDTEKPKETKSKKGQTAKPKENQKGGSQNKTEGKNYADARKRKPRGQGDVAVTKVEKPTQEKSSPAKPTQPKVADGGFASMRGALPRPVDGSWRVTSRFGRQELPDLPGVVYDNPGINVEVAIGTAVKSVYSGKVSGVYMVPGYQTVVIVNHGNYYTAYGNLKSPAVKVGDNVKAGQKLGSAGENLDDPGHGELHFEVYRNRDKLNPLEWIR